MPRKNTATASSETLLIQANGGPSLETNITDDSLAMCNMQSQSPLFGVLPPELRNYIFELATLPHDDEQHLYNPTDYFYRPGHHAKQKIDTAVLLTCRRAWLEANHLPMNHFQPTFWFEWDERRPSWTHHRQAKSKYSLRRSRQIYTTESDRYRTFVESLTATNITNVRTIHFLGQLLFLESRRLSCLLQATHSDLPKIPHIKVTVRHTDWWMWEANEDLHISHEWIEELLSQPWFAKSVETFELELETLHEKVSQLEAIVGDMKREQGEIKGHDGRSCWKLGMETGKEVLVWEGHADVGGYRGRWGPDAEGEKLQYCVHSLVWKCCAA